MLRLWRTDESIENEDIESKIHVDENGSRYINPDEYFVIEDVKKTIKSISGLQFNVEGESDKPEGV